MPDTTRAAQALNLCLAGLDWATIATKLRYADAADAAQAAYDTAAEQYDGPPADPARILEILRLNRLQAALWGAAMKGDLNAGRQALEIADRRVRLMRLNVRSEP